MEQEVKDESNVGAHWRTDTCNCFNQDFKCFTTRLSWNRQRNKFPKFWSSQLSLIFKAAHGSFSFSCKNNIDGTPTLVQLINNYISWPPSYMSVKLAVQTLYRFSKSCSLDLKKINFSFGIFCGWREIWACVPLSGQVYLALAPTQWAIGLAHFFCKTRLWFESLENLIGFLAYLEPRLWLKNPILGKNEKVSRKPWLALSGQILASLNLATHWDR